MKVLAEKRKELAQTILSLIGCIRQRRDVCAATFARVWKMKTNSVFLKNGMAERTLTAT